MRGREQERVERLVRERELLRVLLARARPPLRARELVGIHRAPEAGGLPVAHLCALFGVSRSAFYAARRGAEEAAGGRERRGRRGSLGDEELDERIAEVRARWPAWGHRKVWATLRRAGLRVGRRRVAERLRALRATTPRPEGRASGAGEGAGDGVVAARPNQRLATDLTTVWTRLDGRVAVVLTVDCGCRTVLDATVSRSQAARVVLGGVERALVTAFGSPARAPAGVELRTDRGPQFTGSEAATLARRWGLVQSLTPPGCPTGNAVVERTIQTLKVECLWPEEFEDAEAVQAAVDRWRWSFNHERPHQALGWRTPAEARAERLREGMGREEREKESGEDGWVEEREGSRKEEDGWKGKKREDGRKGEGGGEGWTEGEGKKEGRR